MWYNLYYIYTINGWECGFSYYQPHIQSGLPSVLWLWNWPSVSTGLSEETVNCNMSLTLLLGFKFHLKLDILVIFLNLSNIDLCRSKMVGKLLDNVYCIIGVSILLLCHWYVSKIQFYLLIFPWVKNIKLYNINRSRTFVEAMRSMKLSKV